MAGVATEELTMPSATRLVPELGSFARRRTAVRGKRGAPGAGLTIQAVLGCFRATAIDGIIAAAPIRNMIRPKRKAA
jgi:hypothetical protein